MRRCKSYSKIFHKIKQNSNNVSKLIKEQVQHTSAQKENIYTFSKEIKSLNNELKTTKDLADTTGIKVLSTVKDLKEGFDKCSEYQRDKPITKILQAIEAHSMYLINTTKALEGYDNVILEDYNKAVNLVSGYQNDL